MRIVWIIVLLLIGASRGLVAQKGPGKGIVVGTVLRDSSSTPIDGAELRIDPAGISTRTDSAGRFTFAGIPKGLQRLSVRAVGFKSVTAVLDIPSDGLDGVEVGLEKTVVTLAEVAVRRDAVAPHLRDFDGWRRMGLGHFLDSTQLWTHGDGADWAQRVAERVPGLQLKSYGGSRAFASSRGIASLKGFQKLDVADVRRGARSACYVRVVIDGVLTYNSSDLEPLFDATERIGRPIVAVAYFTNAQQPVEFNRLSSAACGTLALWTQR